MFDDLARPTPATRARLRAMARQLVATGDDEDDTIGRLISSTKKLPRPERIELQRLVDAIQPPVE